MHLHLTISDYDTIIITIALKTMVHDHGIHDRGIDDGDHRWYSEQCPVLHSNMRKTISFVQYIMSRVIRFQYS